MLQRGEQVPHFTVRTVGGIEVVYRDLWQQKNLLLVSVADCDARSDSRLLSQLSGLGSECAALDTECVITAEPVAGMPATGVLVADRWGEIVFVADHSHGSGPDAREILEWLQYVQHRCPECEGEAR